MMKKIEAAVLCLCLLLNCAAVLAADGYSFVNASGQTNSGYPAEIVIKAASAPDTDTVIVITNNTTGEKLETVLGAGETTAVVSFAAPETDKTTTYKYSIEGCKGSYSLKVLAKPRCVFYSKANLGFIGKSATVSVECRNPSVVLAGSNTFQLRDQTGRVYGEKTWRDASNRLSFKIDVTPDMDGKHMLSLWYGDVCVTAQETLFDVTDASVPVVKKIDTTEPYMSITLDCAYYDAKVDKILDVLDKYGVRATFFMTGYFVRELSESAEKIISRGHEIGNHSNTHPHMTTLSEYDQMRQIQKVGEDMYKLYGITPRLFRPPFGDTDKNVAALARGEGQEVVMWTIDSHDWDPEYSKDQVIKRVSKNVTPGTIILFHLDGYFTPEVLDQMIPYYQETLGLKCIPVTELMALEGRYPPELPTEIQYPDINK